MCSIYIHSMYVYSVYTRYVYILSAFPNGIQSEDGRSMTFLRLETQDPGLTVTQSWPMPDLVLHRWHQCDEAFRSAQDCRTLLLVCCSLWDQVLLLIVLQTAAQTQTPPQAHRAVSCWWHHTTGRAAQSTVTNILLTLTRINCRVRATEAAPLQAVKVCACG